MKTPQQIILDLIDQTQFNRFYGPTIAKTLRENTKLYKSIMFANFEYGVLSALQSLEFGVYQADTIAALVPSLKLDKFLEMVNDFWSADEIGYLSYGEAVYGPFFDAETVGRILNPGEALIRVWWD
jgi:hypothetical protein